MIQVQVKTASERSCSSRGLEDELRTKDPATQNAPFPNSRRFRYLFSLIFDFA